MPCQRAKVTSSTKRRGHHATKACNGCRRRRCKCDGVHPVCGTCSFYGHECTWSQEEDARRPATKQLVESLRVRIRELETELAQVKARSGTNEEEGMNIQHDNPGLSAIDPEPITPVTVKIEEEFPNQSVLTIQEGTISASGPTSMWATFPTDQAELEKRTTPDSNLMYQFAFRTDRSVPLHMQPHEIQLSEICEWSRHLPDLGDVNFTRLEHDVLLDRFFNFHTIWILSIVPELFLRDMLAMLVPENLQMAPARPVRAQSYSAFLHCAIMSVAAAFSDDPEIRSKETREKFASSAKQYLESECERPTIPAVQALGFLSEYHGGFGERGLAYLFSGMSNRLTRALGLCIHGQAWVNAGQMTPQELIHRDWQFWSVFCQDKIMSLDFGRDYEIALPHLNVNLPVVDPDLDQKAWTGHSTHSIEVDKHQPNNGTLVFYETCRLMLVAVRIMDAVYTQGRQNWRVTEKDSVSQIHLVLETWYNKLPEELLVSSRSSSRPPPHVLTLNIAYWWLLMLLHRPFYARTQRSASHASTEQPPTSFTDLSVKFCDRAATKIVQIIMLYDQCHGLRYFPLNMIQVIFIAGATLLVQAATLSGLAVKKRTDAHEGTRKCIRALRAIAQTWECAGMCASHLEHLLQEQTGESSVSGPVSLSEQAQNLSAESSPMTRQSQLPHEGAYTSHGTYNVDSPSQVLPQMFRDFIAQQDQNMELGYMLPAQAPPLRYPELNELHQQPLMGMPSGAQFMAFPHILPLPYDPNFNAAYHNTEPGEGDQNHGHTHYYQH